MRAWAAVAALCLIMKIGVVVDWNKIFVGRNPTESKTSSVWLVHEIHEFDDAINRQGFFSLQEGFDKFVARRSFAVKSVFLVFRGFHGGNDDHFLVSDIVSISRFGYDPDNLNYVHLCNKCRGSSVVFHHYRWHRVSYPILCSDICPSVIRDTFNVNRSALYTDCSVRAQTRCIGGLFSDRQRTLCAGNLNSERAPCIGQLPLTSAPHFVGRPPEGPSEQRDEYAGDGLNQLLVSGDPIQRKIKNRTLGFFIFVTAFCVCFAFIFGNIGNRPSLRRLRKR